jgi:hypothetical protein
LAGWSAGSVHELLRSRCSAAFSNYFSARSAARRLRRTYCDLATRRRPRGVRALRFCSCRLSASTVLKLFQPAAGCCTLETVLAMAQPVRVHNGTSSRCAAALGLRSGPVLQVCRALRRLPPAVHRSHFSDCASCARMSGSCSASRSTTRPSIGDHRHTRRRSAALGVLMQPVGAQRRLCATDGHVRMTSSRAPAAAGITHTHQWHAWVRV